MISVFGNLSQIMKLWVNLNSAVLRCSAVIPKAVIGEPSAIFNFAVAGCIGVFETIINMLVC